MASKHGGRETGIFTIIISRPFYSICTLSLLLLFYLGILCLSAQLNLHHTRLCHQVGIIVIKIHVHVLAFLLF